ncbi:MAG: CFI-box-CTERM domain-containing protein, partial [Nitrososphaerota archaeon]
MKNGFFSIITLIIITPITIFSNDQAYSQMPNIDTSIIDKTSDLMDKSEQVLEKTETVVEKTGEVVAEAKDATGSLSGGCLIVTATFGSELAPQVQFLREIRDNTVLSTASGTSFMTAFNSFYYSFSPAVSDLE